ncbi:MAG: hypothetical protein PHE56_02260 [Bacteroidales bacterium]|jgi:hypothetical protein|nr:hypothetical protein [Bacteroidales bacterium]
MKYISLIIIAFISLIVVSCSTDFDVNGEWKDIPVVYCVLDQSSEYQYVKVNKSFLGPVPASQMAQVSDSLFYENVIVVVHEYVNSYKTNTWTFEAVDSIPKEDGYFATDKNTIWVKKMNLNVDARYEIEVTINGGQHIVKGETKLIDGIYIKTPANSLPFVDLKNYNGDSPYEYNNGDNAKIFQMTLTFNYLEVKDGDTTYYSITWPQAKEYKTTETSQIVSGKFSVLAFYNLLVAQIPPAEQGVKRYVKMPNSIDYNLAAADETYLTYMEVTSPSNGIVQEKPSYTNLDGGYGLFASRFNVYRSKLLSRASLDSLSRGIYTKDLGFVDAFDDYYDPYF